MKPNCFFAALLSFMLMALAYARIWTDNNGNQMVGDYSGVSQNGDTVKIKTEDGRTYFVPYKNLSLDDQDYVQREKKLANINNPSSTDNSSSDQSGSPDDGDPNKTVVIVIGAGETIEDAKKDAMRNAVERVTGSLVDAQTKLHNDELSQQIVTASSAYIEKSEVLASKKVNGLVKVKMRATVVKRPFHKKDNFLSDGHSLVIDGANEINKIKSKNESEINGAIFLSKFLKKEGFPYSLLNVRFLREPEIVQNGNTYTYTLMLSVSINRERYMDFAKRAKPIFDQYAIQHGTFVLRTETDSDGDILYHRTNAPGYTYEGEYLPFYLCTDMNGYYQAMKFDIYELPIKFSIPLYLYKRVVPCARISFIDSANNEVASKTIMLYRDKQEPVNVMPSMFDSLRCNSSISQTNGESTVFDSSLTNLCGLAVFAPYIRSYTSGSNTFYIIPRNVYKIQMTFTAEELARIQTATVTVSAKNSKLDQIYKSIPSVLNKVPSK